jgi:hypothetical protein
MQGQASCSIQPGHGGGSGHLLVHRRGEDDYRDRELQILSFTNLTVGADEISAEMLRQAHVCSWFLVFPRGQAYIPRDRWLWFRFGRLIIVRQLGCLATIVDQNNDAVPVLYGQPGVLASNATFGL